LKYDGQIDILNDSNSQSLLLRRVRPGWKVLELGPGPGRMTRYLSEELNCTVFAVERDQEFCNETAKWAQEVIRADLDELTWSRQLDEQSFDCVICADVLEHLVDPWATLNQAKKLLKDDGALLVSLPNAAHSAVILNLLNDNMPYQETGLLDQTHLRFFTHTTARKLLEDTGFHILEEEATYRPVHQTLLYDTLPNHAMKASSILRNRPYANVFQFVFQACCKQTVQDDRPTASSIQHWTTFELLKKTTNPMLFIGGEEDFSAENVLTNHTRNDDWICYDLSRQGEFKRVRFDPCEQACVVQLNAARLVTDDGREHALELVDTTGTPVTPDIIEFSHSDPALIFNVPQEAQGLATAEFRIEAPFLSIQSEPSPLGLKRFAEIERASGPGSVPPGAGPDRQDTARRLLLRRCEELETENETMRVFLGHRAVKPVVALIQRHWIVTNILLFPFYVMGYLMFGVSAIWRAPRRLAKLGRLIWDRCPIRWSAKKRRLETEHPGITRPVDIGVLKSLELRYRELDIVPIESDAPGVRVNFLFPSLVPDLTFGGYIAALRFVEKLIDQGCIVRLVICDDQRLTHKKLLDLWAHNPKRRDLFAKCEFHNLNRLPIEVCREDRFIAYCGWVGLYAHQLAKATSDQRFVFFIQEYEPVFHPNDSLRAALESVYNLPHVPMFNTPVLQDYFQKERLGVYSPDYQGRPGARTFPFAHAIADLKPPAIEDLSKRTTHKVLFYARPEGHAARNLFALGMLGLKTAIQRGAFPGKWEFWGIGSLADCYSLDLGLGHTLNIIPRVPQDEYEQFILGFDIGISYMMAPHPSVLPFEMLSAGLVVVTNEYKYRNAEFFAGISKNIVSCKMSPDSMADALEAAATKAIDPTARLRDAHIECNHSWDETFDPEFIQRFIGEISE